MKECVIIDFKTQTVIRPITMSDGISIDLIDGCMECPRNEDGSYLDIQKGDKLIDGNFYRMVTQKDR